MTGGILTEQKPLRKISFKSLDESLADPGTRKLLLQLFDSNSLAFDIFMYSLCTCYYFLEPRLCSLIEL